jgi:TolB protein
LVLCTLLLLLTALAVAPNASATFPGANGRIAYQQAFGSTRGLATANPDGTDKRVLAPSGFRPDWSPDGTRVAYLDGPTIYVVNADGTGSVPVFEHSDGVRAVAWSPDGLQIAWADVGTAGCSNAIRVVNADGTDPTVLRMAEGCRVLDLDWGPDGRLTYMVVDSGNTNARLFVAAPTDPPAAPLRTGFGTASEAFSDWAPGQRLISAGVSSSTRVSLDGAGDSLLTPRIRTVWSPDGSYIAGDAAPPRVTVTNDAGSGATSISTTGPSGLGATAWPDWQPLPPLPEQPGYAHPKSATPLHASLVPAYEPCTSPNRVHAAPLSYSSCNPPQPTSNWLIVGTPDANGTAANYTGSLRLTAVLGNPSTPADEADVAITVHLTDIRCQASTAACTGGALSDYTGEVTAFLLASITDRQSGGTVAQPATGTLANWKLPGRFSLPCTPTPDPNIGSNCDTVTSIDALAPNVIKEGKRSIWELDQILISDGGPNGDPTEFAETPFLVQGLFVP